MMILITFSLILVLTSGFNLRSVEQTDSQNMTSETNYYCQYVYECPDHSSCIQYNKTTGICSCDDNYASLNGFCDYKRKSSLVGLLLSIFLDEAAPIGRMYSLNGVKSTDNYSQKVAVAELFTCGLLGFLIVWTCFTILFLLLNICGICKGDNREEIEKLYWFFCKIIANIISITTFIWWIFDIVQFASGTVKDQNGVPLNSI